MPLTERLTELWIEQLKNLHSLESQLVKVLPRMARAAESDDVRGLLLRHRVRARKHAEILSGILTEVEETPGEVTCGTMVRLIAEWDPGAGDVQLLRTARKAVHEEIGRLSKAINGAMVLGYDDLAEPLRNSMQEELRGDAELAKLGLTLHESVQRFLAA